MPNPERQPSQDLIQPEPRGQDTPRAIKTELKQEPTADETKIQTYPAKDKIPGARRLDKANMDKGEQFRLQDEIDRLQDIMKNKIRIAGLKLRGGQEDNESLARKVRGEYEPQIAKLQLQLQEQFGERENLEGLLPQLQQQAKKSDDERTTKKEKLDHLQRIPITPELRAVQKKAAQKDIEDAYKKLTDAEDALAEAEKQRPGAISRFFSRFKIGKQPTEVSAYQLAFQDASTPPEELKKLETAAINASTSKASASEIAYQQAIRMVGETKKLVTETEKSILDSGIYAEPQEKKKTVVHGGIRFEKPAPATRPATAAETSHKIPFKPSESEKPREQTAEEKFAELTRRIIVYGETKNIGAITDYDYVSPAELTDKMVKKLFTKAEELNKSAYAEDKRDSAAIRKGLEHFRIYGATAATAESTRARAKARGAAIKREITPPDYSSIGGGGLGIDSVVKAMRIKK